MADEIAWRINFSHVLHERSTCQSVRQAVHIANRFAAKQARLLAKFDRLSDEQLQHRVLISPQMQDVTLPPLVLSPPVGLPSLLPRALRLLAPSTSDDVEFIDPFAGRPGDTEMACAHFFGSPSCIASPATFSGARSCLVAACVVRPGDHSLLVTGAQIQRPSSGSESDPHWNDEVLRALETVIREHCNQWTPAHQLWDNPVEEKLPEFKTPPMNR